MAQEKLPDWDRPWDDFIHEEIWEKSLLVGQHKSDDENLALASWVVWKKGKGSSNRSEEPTSQRKKKDLTKVKCFSWHKTRPYAL